MSVEIGFPLEFIVPGTPVSLQSKRPEVRSGWRDHVRQASREALPEGYFAAPMPLAVTMFYFPSGRMQGDIDNIVKPVLDALCRHIYLDDRQVERVWVQKFEPDRVFAFRSPSPVLARALGAEKPLLYVRVADDCLEGLS